MHSYTYIVHLSMSGPVFPPPGHWRGFVHPLLELYFVMVDVYTRLLLKAAGRAL